MEAVHATRRGTDDLVVGYALGNEHVLTPAFELVRVDRKWRAVDRSALQAQQADGMPVYTRYGQRGALFQKDGVWAVRCLDGTLAAGYEVVPDALSALRVPFDRLPVLCKDHVPLLATVSNDRGVWVVSREYGDATTDGWWGACD